MIGALLKFSGEKRALYHPTAPVYQEFHGAVGLCTSYTVKETGEEHVEVRWLKPVEYGNRKARMSHFQLSNFEIIGGKVK